MKITLVELDDETHKAFKMQCLVNNQTIKDAMVELVKYYIKEPKLKEDANKK